MKKSARREHRLSGSTIPKVERCLKLMQERDRRRRLGKPLHQIGGQHA